MALLFLLAILALPLLEIAVFIQVGGALGVTSTLAATLLTAAIGVYLMRTQGLSTLKAVRGSLDHGDMPLRSAFDGACQLTAGLFLLIPGFVTDTVGLLLFIPPLRSILLAWLLARSNVTVVVRDGPMPRRGYDVDGEYRDLTKTESGDGTSNQSPALPRHKRWDEPDSGKS
jgi:UPF0716 protein FxsA